MLLDVHVPYSARVRMLEGKTLVRECMVKAVVPMEIREIEASEAPIVARFEGDAGIVTVRSVDGRCVVRSARPEGYADDAAWLVDSASHTFGRCGWHRIGRRDSVLGSLLFESDPRIKIQRSDNWREQDVSYARKAALDLVLIDGELWAACRDPILALTFGKEDDVGRAKVVVQAPDEHEHDGLNSFRLDEGHLVSQYMEAIMPGHGSQPVLPYVDVVDPKALTYEPQLSGLRFAGSLVALSMKEALADAPLEQLVRFARVRDLALGRPDPAPTDAREGGEAMRQAIVDAYETMPDLEYFRDKIVGALACWDVFAANVARRALEDDTDVQSLAF